MFLLNWRIVFFSSTVLTPVSITTTIIIILIDIVPEPAALFESVCHLQLETSRGSGSAVFSGCPQLRIFGTGTSSDSGLPYRAVEHRGGVASQGEHARGSCRAPQSCSWICQKLGRFWPSTLAIVFFKFLSTCDMWIVWKTSVIL